MKKLICWVFFHDLVVVKNYGYASQKLKCNRCKRYYGINHSVRAFIPWDYEMEVSMKDLIK